MFYEKRKCLRKLMTVKKVIMRSYLNIPVTPFCYAQISHWYYLSEANVWRTCERLEVAESTGQKRRRLHVLTTVTQQLVLRQHRRKLQIVILRVFIQDLGRWVETAHPATRKPHYNKCNLGAVGMSVVCPFGIRCSTAMYQTKSAVTAD